MAKHPVAKTDAALPRVTAREILSISHEVSRLSPVTADTCLPNLRKKATVEGPSTPVVSTETGSNKYRSVRARYRSRLRVSAAAAAEPGATAASTTEVVLNVSTHVASHARHFPWLYGNIVTLSGRRPSPRSKPTGSSHDSTVELRPKKGLPQTKMYKVTCYITG